MPAANSYGIDETPEAENASGVFYKNIGGVYMSLLSSEWTARVEHWIRTIQLDFYEPLGEIHLSAMRTMECLNPHELDISLFKPVNAGFTWGEKWEYCWFSGSFQIPKSAAGERIVMDLNPGGESTLYVNDKAFGTYRADWVGHKHQYMADNFVTTNAKEGETFSLLMETYAGHFYPNYSHCATGPVIPGTYEDPATEGERRVLGTCTFGIWREDAYQLYMDLETLYSLFKELDDSSMRAVHVAAALKEATKIIEFETDKDSRLESYRKARETLKDAMEAVNGTSAPRFYAVGNSHLDLAWLWPVEETQRKTVRTFAAQLRLLDEYPKYRFIQSQPAEYELCRQQDPELFERIRQSVQDGRWIADGAMWVEPDTNMSSGEALIRQLMYGKRYYKDMFGVDSHVLWLPDTFGYTAALPQILKGCDVQYLVTQKIFWSYNEGEEFPYHYFKWEGMDGSQVTSFLPTSYTYKTDPGELIRTWKSRRQKEDLETFLLPFGYGDGGGGPVRDHIEFVQRQADLEGSPRVEMVSPEEFFVEMEKEGGPKHTYTGELYFTAHRGTYTVQAKIKKNNRKSELALRELEFWSGIAQLWKMPYDAEASQRMWKVLLFNQFHDILPGSSIGRVYERANNEHEKLQDEAYERTQKALEWLTVKNERAVTVCNSLPFERNAIVQLPDYFKHVKTADGTSVPTDADGYAFVTVPSMGMCALYEADDNDMTSSEKTVAAGELNAAFENQNDKKTLDREMAVTAVQKDGFICMENDKICVKINANGEVISYVRKDSGREFAQKAMNHLRLFKDVPRYFDAWDIDSTYKEQELDGAFDCNTVIKKSSGLRAEVCVTGKIGNSSYSENISLDYGSDRIEFELTVDWKELHRLLKVSFPVEVYATNAKHEMQFGYVERPTHDSKPYDKDRFEVCNHHYTALTDAGHGAVILNDCKYGINVDKNDMNLTLLRAAASPQMRSDNGVHTMKFAFMGYEGDFAHSDTVRAGYELNVPVKVILGAEQNMSFASVDRKNVILETIKPAEDGSGDLILRLYEASGAACNATVTLAPKIAKAWKTNLLETDEGEISCSEHQIKLDFRAFEIRTVRVQVNDSNSVNE